MSNDFDAASNYLGTTTTGAAGATTTGALGATTTGRLTPGATTAGPRATGRRTQAEAGSIKEAIRRDRKSTRLNSSHVSESRMPSSA